jgi:hypothetical protein
VGTVRPTDFEKTMCHPQVNVRPTVAGGPPAGEAERILQRVDRNLIALTHLMSMAEIEDLLSAMQPHVVGVPRTWVQLSWRLVNVVVHYTRVNRPRT